MGISPVMQQQFVSTPPQPVPFQHTPVPEPRQQQLFVPSQGSGPKIPSLKDMKLRIKNFSVKEMYEGLRAGFKDWGLMFLDELIATQVIRGGDWREPSRLVH
ncbi:Pol Polyprotein [Phytophthora cinnamomi]|uniref:Pol Polyprotein n=1 Tax=Phytophthora cinnamomi TaxID=4785 RepID=UPI0035597D5C|nr:Pol Polyprotein [Phytophthora cinnamomi]